MARPRKKKEKATPKAASGRGGARRIEVPQNPTFGVDDKRAQYARLVVFNFGVSEKIIDGKKRDVNSATNAELTKAVNSLAGGTLLNGSDGIELIQKLTQKGATDEKVASRGLTRAYAQEVRPFIKRKQLSDTFGRRGRTRAAETPEETPEEAPAAA